MNIGNAEEYLEVYDIITELEGKIAAIKKPILKQLGEVVSEDAMQLRAAKELLADLKRDLLAEINEAEQQRKQQLKDRKLAAPINLPPRMNVVRNKKVEIVDPAALPKDVFCVDERALKALMKSRKGDVAGAKYVEDLTLRVKS